MTFFSRHKKLLLLFGSVGLIYMIQFLILPSFFGQFYPLSNEATAILFIPLLAMALIGTLCFHVTAKAWLAADAMYFILLCAYHGRGLYGIGLRGVMLDGMHPVYSFPLAMVTIFALLVVMIIVQLLLCALRHWVLRK